MNDGLVSNVSLILGAAGAHPGGAIIRLAGLAGLFGGAFSMAVGEYVSMQAQREALEYELALEKEEIRRRPLAERKELVHIYERRGIRREIAEKLAEELMADPTIALETHAREELGIDPKALGSPLQAAGSSFATFSLGALIPLLPFLGGSGGTGAILLAIGLSALAVLIVGSLLSRRTAGNRLRPALRQLALCAIAGAVTFGIGSAIGASAG